MSTSTGTLDSSISFYPLGSTWNGSINTDKQFTGQRLDATTLYYYEARYYDSSIGRFISADSAAPDLMNPQSFNKYTYCFNNPLNRNDPTGNWPNWANIGKAITNAAKAGGQAAVDTAKNTAKLTVETVKVEANVTMQAGANFIVSSAEHNAKHSEIVKFVANQNATIDTQQVASQLPAQNVIQVDPDNPTGWLVNTFLHGAVTLNGTVVTTKDITQPNSVGGYDTWTTLHEEKHVVQQSEQQNFYWNYFFSGGNNYNSTSSDEGQANSFADLYQYQINVVPTLNPDPNPWNLWWRGIFD